MAFQVQGSDLARVEALEAVNLPEDLDWEVTTWDRVKNLVWIKENTVYKEALADWEREINEKGERLLRRQKRSEELTNQIYNLVGFFSVFQGVILTAVTQLTQSTSSSSSSSSACNCARPLCGKVWFPIVLSVLAALAAVLGIGLRFSELHKVDIRILMIKREQAEVWDRGSKLREQGEKFRFKSLKHSSSNLPQPRAFVQAVSVIATVLVFTVFFILSYFVILCDKWVIKGWWSK